MGKENKKESHFDRYHRIFKEEHSLKRQEEREDDEQHISSSIDDVTVSALKDMRGEHARWKGKPKSYSVNTHEEAHDLVVRIGRQYMKHAGIPDVKDDHMVLKHIDMALGQPGASQQMIAQFRDYSGNLMKHQAYEQLKKSLADDAANGKLNAARDYIASDTDNRSKLEDALNKAAAEQGVQIVKNLNGHKLASHLGNAYAGEGKLTAAYVKKHYRKDFKPLAKKE